MALALFTLTVLSTLLAAVAMLLGLTIRSVGDLSMHIHIGWVAALGLLFSHAMTVFFLAGIAKALREATEGRDDLAGYREEYRRLRVRLWPVLVTAATFVVVLVVTGGAAWGGKVSILLHRRIAFATVGINVLAMLWEGVVLYAIQAMRNDCEAALAGEAASGPRL